MPGENELNRFPVRKNPRSKYIDYTSQNYYFVTICTKDKRCLFGEPSILSEFGRVAKDRLEGIAEHFCGVTVDKWVVMPNHVHAIIVLNGNGVPLSTVIGQYKSAVTRQLHKISPDISIWQNSFHDHVIRNQKDYERIWSYIDANPARWMDDCFYVPSTNLKNSLIGGVMTPPYEKEEKLWNF